MKRASPAKVILSFDLPAGYTTEDAKHYIQSVLGYKASVAHRVNDAFGDVDFTVSAKVDNSLQHLPKSVEPEFTAPDGSTRKTHYGLGEQPIDIIMKEGWAVDFAAGNVLKYIRRYSHKNGQDDIVKARWYYAFLEELATNRGYARDNIVTLKRILTEDELQLVTSGSIES